MSARGVFAAAVALFAAVLVVTVLLLPDRVPLHFDASGDVDRWASRTEAVVTMAVVGALVAALLGGTAAAMGRMPLSLVNLPHKDWWTASPERERQLRSRLAADVHVIGAATMVLLAAVELLTLRAARADEPRLDAWAWVTVGAYLVLVVAWAVWLVRVRYRPPPDPPAEPPTTMPR